ncbi:HTH-type transcriptional regulator BhcR [uncultured Shimia sp.]|uniref:HTH-type transcriptional regulator BhcR n=1 Tax=uncultured Shimia sp. TaxID=573152 RepID=UPI002607EA21|nr:HTH-type transcriptional regulator BhcR [uncultured Shimia sp.]
MQPPLRKKGRPKAFNSEASTNPIQSLDRALVVLETLGMHSGLTLSELADELDQSPATMYRVLSTLSARGFVETDPQTQEWHIGPVSFRLGSAFLRRSSVVERARPVMRKLVEATGETANLGIEKDNRVMFVSQVETHESIRAFFPPGTQSQMHASGIGKALLSLFPERRMDRFLREQQLTRFTDKTLSDPDTIRAEMAKARTLGYAVDDEEKNLGMRCVAAPIVNFYGEAVAGISVSGPVSRLTTDRIPEVAALVSEAAQELSRGLGADTPNSED